MRIIAAVLALLISNFFMMTTPTLAQSTLRACPGVDLTAPADGAVLDPGYRANFTWDSEPRGTASREWVAVRVDMDDDSFSFEDAKKAKAEPGLYKGFARGRPGIYAWAVIFYDVNGKPICQSEARTYVVVGSGFASLSGPSSAGAIAAVKAAMGNWIVRLTGFDPSHIAYNGPVNQNVPGTVYIDALNPVDYKAQGYAGLEVQGSALPDVIIGSAGNDVLNGNGGTDTIFGGDGDDTINGGSGGDLLFGEGGDDTINGGSGYDIISGGSGTDSGFGDSDGGFCTASTESQTNC